jgi:hypothetical protein
MVILCLTQNTHLAQIVEIVDTPLDADNQHRLFAGETENVHFVANFGHKVNFLHYSTPKAIRIPKKVVLGPAVKQAS